MTIWQPALDEAGPLYLAITRALESDIATGRLAPGDRLPPHRDLAEALGVNVGTVSRAYAEARRRGLVRGEVGRGTYVQRPERSPLASAGARGSAGVIDLSVNTPPPEPPADWASALRALADCADLDERLGYADPRGSARLRAAGARWLSEHGQPAEADEIVVCAGAQHAILVALAATVGPGEVVLCEALTYPGFLAAARTLGLRVQPVPIDDQGLVPEALEAICASERPRLLYCMPALQNPTASVLPEARRRRIAEIARAHDLTLLRDDIQTGIVDDPAPCLSSFAPERVLSIVSLSKSLAPGLRIAFLTGRGLDRERAHDAVWSSLWMASPLGAEVATHWIESGHARARLLALRAELRARHAIAARALRGIPFVTRPGAQHLWLPVAAAQTTGEPPGAALLTRALEDRGVRVSPAAAFAVRPAVAPAAIRVSISAPASHAALERGLEIVAGTLGAPEALRRTTL